MSFSKMLKFSKRKKSHDQDFVKENIESARIFYLLK